MDLNGSKFYYSRLTDGEKQVYDRICEALLRFESALSFHAGKAFLFDIKKIITAVLFDNPVFFYLNRHRIVTKQTPLYIQLVFQYDYEKDEADALWKQIEESVAAFADENLRPDMTPLARQLKIHNHLRKIEAAKEPYDKDDFSVVGALLHGKCVCEGYAKAYKLLCDRAGIASIVVTGEALLPDGRREAHSWNLSRINGVTAHTDVSWDAMLSGAAYDYFNLCDADIAADHVFDAALYPPGEPNEINYFSKNSLIAKNESELLSLITAHKNDDYFAVKLLFPFSEEQTKSLPFGAGEIRYNNAQNVVGFAAKEE